MDYSVYSRAGKLVSLHDLCPLRKKQEVLHVRDTRNLQSALILDFTASKAEGTKFPKSRNCSFKGLRV